MLRHQQPNKGCPSVKIPDTSRFFDDKKECLFMDFLKYQELKNDYHIKRQTNPQNNYFKSKMEKTKKQKFKSKINKIIIRLTNEGNHPTASHLYKYFSIN